MNLKKYNEIKKSEIYVCKISTQVLCHLALFLTITLALWKSYPHS